MLLSWSKSLPPSRLDTLQQLNQETGAFLCPECIFYSKTLYFIRLAQPVQLHKQQSQMRHTRLRHSVILFQFNPSLILEYRFYLPSFCCDIPMCPQNKLSDKAAKQMYFLLLLPQKDVCTGTASQRTSSTRCDLTSRLCQKTVSHHGPV